MEVVMGESGEVSKEAADSSRPCSNPKSVHINGEMNGSCEAMDVDDDAIISSKSVGEIKNVNDACDGESDSDSISGKANSCGKVPNEDSVKSSELGTEVPNNNVDDIGQDQMEVDEQNLSLETIKNSDKENELVVGLDSPKVVNSTHDKIEGTGTESNCSDIVNEQNVDTSSSISSTKIQSNDEKVTENGETKISSNLDNDEISDDCAKQETSTPGHEKQELGDKTEDKNGNASSSESKSGETTPAKVKKSRKSLPPANVTPRRSSRNLSRAQKSYSEPKDDEPEEEEEPAEEDNDPDIEEITPVDPLADPLSTDVRGVNRPRINHARKTTIVVSDTKKLVEIAAGARTMKGGKKEPTLVIIDTNSILSGRGPIPISQTNSHNHSHSHSHTITTLPSTSSSAGYSVLPVTMPPQTVMYPKQRAAQQPIPIHIPIPKPHPPPPPPQPQPPPPPPPQILPTLTDDMYVVEAPSFIVPYVYEKPPIKPLKEFIKKLSDEIVRLTKLEEENEKKQKEEENEKKQKEEENEKKQKEEENEKKQEEESEKKQKEEESEKKQEEKEKSDESNKNEENNVELSSVMIEDKKDSSSTPESSEKIADKDIEEVKSTVNENKTEDSSEIKNIEEKPDVTKKADEAGESEESKSLKSETSKEKEDKVSSSDEVVDKSSEKQVGGTGEEPVVLDDTKKEKNAVDEKDKEKLPEENKPKTSTYFDNPLGKFFMQIGTSLVTEAVQTQLLREQKRKRDRDTGKVSSSTQVVINHLLNNLELSKENNQHFHLPIKKCEFCSFRTESALVMAQHLETPHMRNYVYRCNFCPLEVRSPHDILFHMEAEHNVRGRLERAPAFHQCPNCPFEDNQKGKLTRHLLSCTKKFKPEKNLEPPPDWEPPAKIPRISRNRPMAGGLGAAAYQAMVKQQLPQQHPQQHPLLPKLPPSLTAMPGAMRGRGRPVGPTGQARYLPDMKLNAQGRNMPPVTTTMRPGMLYRPSGSGSQPQVLLPTSYQIAGNQIFQVVGSQGQMIPMTSQASRLTASSHSSAGPTPVALVPNIAAGSSTITIQSTSKQQQATAKLMQQPSISITPLPRQPAMNSPHSSAGQNRQAAGQQAQGSSKTTFVICEICDGYIKDLDQLRNHMMWIHKVKIHPKMIYNRPPLNCQKCQFRFFTDQGLERHLLGSHGLVTSSMQEAANKGKDAGRCPICGRVYQWKLLNHVARDHSMTLKPAHLSYKCTVCTATFGMYKQFENHVYSAHSVVAKRVMEKKSSPQITRLQPSESLLKSAVKLTDEITIIPQLAQTKPGPASRTGKTSVNEQNSATSVHQCDVCDATFDGSNGFVQYLTHYRRRHLRRCSIKVCRLDSCPTCKERHLTPRLLNMLEEKRNVDVIELSDDEIVIAGQGRNEITITKVASAPGPRRFKQRLNNRNVQIIDIDDSPVKSGVVARENGEDALTAVKERLRRRKSLEISQIDSEGSSPQLDEGTAKKRRRIDN